MNNPEIFNQNILNQITSEIVVLDKDLKVVWVNDSAITKSWKISDEHSDINSQFSFQTNAELKQLIDKYSKIVQKNDGEIVKTENWGLINLSYLIKKNKKGRGRIFNSYHMNISPLKVYNNMKNNSQDVFVSRFHYQKPQSKITNDIIIAKKSRTLGTP